MYVLPIESHRFLQVTFSIEAILVTFLPQYEAVYMVPHCFVIQTETEK